MGLGAGVPEECLPPVFHSSCTILISIRINAEDVTPRLTSYSQKDKRYWFHSHTRGV